MIEMVDCLESDYIFLHADEAAYCEIMIIK